MLMIFDDSLIVGRNSFLVNKVNNSNGTILENYDKNIFLGFCYIREKRNNSPDIFLSFEHYTGK